jgi:FAD synthetase
MSLAHLASKYIISAEHVLGTMQIVEDRADLHINNIKQVVESARAYLEDAKYFKNEGKIEVSLTSVAYCEGLLDALRLLGAVKFEWPSRAKSEREKQY